MTPSYLVNLGPKGNKIDYNMTDANNLNILRLIFSHYANFHQILKMPLFWA